MAKLILLRHFQSQWNLENRFTGWVDVPLCQEGLDKVPAVGRKLSQFQLDVIYSSPLVRNLDSVLKISAHLRKYPIFQHLKGKMKDWGHFAEIAKTHIPVYISEALNERYYGKLQGLNKEEEMKKYGQEKVRLWRRSFKIAPPGGENLKDVYQRAVPFFQKYIEKDLKEGKNVLVVASHNSLRAIIKYLEKISDDDIINVEVPYAGLLSYEFEQGKYLWARN